MQMHSPAHPGVILREHMGETLTVSDLARHFGITHSNLSMILNGRLGISAATALKPSETVPSSRAEFWLALQAQYDLAKVRKQKLKKLDPLAVAPDAALLD